MLKFINHIAILIIYDKINRRNNIKLTTKMPESAKSTLESITSSVSSFAKELFARRDPYILVQKPVRHLEIEDSNPLKYNIEFYKENSDTILKSMNENLEKQGNQLRIFRKDFDEALKYLVPEKELKSGDSVQVVGGNVTYEEFQEVAKNVGKVMNSNKQDDEKTPRIFILPELSTQNFGAIHVAQVLLMDSGVSAASYSKNHDAIILNRNFIDRHNPDEVKAFVAHEYGHEMIAKAEGGIIELASSTTSPYAASQSELEKIKACINHNEEYKADLIAALSNHDYGKSLSKVFIDLKMPKDNSHPSSEQRVELIGKALANPELYTDELRADLAKFREHASDPTATAHSAKVPVLHTADVVKQCTGRLH